MKKTLLWILLLCTLSAQADTTSDKDSIGRIRDPYYLQFFVGFNKSANENLPFSEFSRYPWSGGAFFAVGREITPLWGWRTALRINRNKSRNVQKCESPDTYAWNNIGLFGDVTFDVSDAFRREKRDKTPKFDVKAFAGIGAAYTWNFSKTPLSYTHEYSRKSKLLPALRAGLTASYNVNEQWRLGAEISQTLFEDHFNGVAYDTQIDGRTNLKVGVTYLLGKAKKKGPQKPVVRKNKLKKCPILPLIMPDPEDTKMRQIQGRAFLDFPVNETVIYPDYRKNPSELTRIQKTVDSALFDKSVTIVRITLHGYASPESPYSNNTRLAKGRTEALKNFLVRKYHFDSRIFKSEFTPEDWGNLSGFLIDAGTRRVKGDFWYDNKDYVETPEMPDFVRENRNELLRVINRSMDPDAKEELLKRVGGGEPYKWLLEHVYPGLRHTDYIIDYQIRPFSVEKGRRLIYTHPEGLSLEEMYNVAMSYEEGSDNWLDALVIAARQYPNNETANLNAACGYVMTKRLNDARKHLSKAGKSAEARYVSDVINAMEGNVDWRLENGRVIVIE
jgi:outer membrane protein OmpA-like peptidoglycan-associated protein